MRKLKLKSISNYDILGPSNNALIEILMLSSLKLAKIPQKVNEGKDSTGFKGYIFQNLRVSGIIRAVTVRDPDVWRTTASAMKPRSRVVSTASVRAARTWTWRRGPRWCAPPSRWGGQDQGAGLRWGGQPRPVSVSMTDGSNPALVSSPSCYRPILL